VATEGPPGPAEASVLSFGAQASEETSPPCRKRTVPSRARASDGKESPWKSLRTFLSSGGAVHSGSADPKREGGKRATTTKSTKSNDRRKDDMAPSSVWLSINPLWLDFR